MKLTNLYTKTKKDAPSDEVAKNAQLLIKAGFIHKEMAGVYSYMPLGLKVLRNIIQIIREEMDAIGGQEMFLTSLQRPELWKSSGRWDDEVVDVWFKSQLANGNEVGLANTHEEALTDTMKQYINSYKDLPVYPYQFQTKLRNELRAKSGIMRSREFIMKDLYSFSASEEDRARFYDQAIEAYTKVFERVGLGDSTYLTYADGGSFAPFSHEFQTISDAGEDTIYLDRDKKIAINKEVYSDEIVAELGLDKSNLEELKAAEVGNIFNLGTKFSEPLGLNFTDEQGKQHPVVMGSYGIGPGRTMGVVVETYSDDAGLVWPESIAPAKYHIVSLGDSKEVHDKAEEIYKKLSKDSDVILDDRDLGAGAKLADADLIGVPIRIVVSEKSLAAGGVEVKKRTEDTTEIKSADLSWV